MPRAPTRLPAGRGGGVGVLALANTRPGVAAEAGGVNGWADDDSDKRRRGVGVREGGRASDSLESLWSCACNRPRCLSTADGVPSFDDLTCMREPLPASLYCSASDWRFPAAWRRCMLAAAAPAETGGVVARFPLCCRWARRGDMALICVRPVASVCSVVALAMPLAALLLPACAVATWGNVRPFPVRCLGTGTAPELSPSYEP